MGVNSTPLDLNDIVLISSLDRSADLEGYVNVRSMTVFHVICLRERPSLSPNDCREEGVYMCCSSGSSVPELAEGSSVGADRAVGQLELLVMWQSFFLSVLKGL